MCKYIDGSYSTQGAGLAEMAMLIAHPICHQLGLELEPLLSQTTLQYLNSGWQD